MCILIDNFSKDKQVHELLDQIKHTQLSVIKNSVNYGKAYATNAYLAETINHENCPRILISMDPDVVFDVDSFNKLIEALDNIPNLGMLGMRYKNNGCNPERNVWLPPKIIKAKQKQYKIRCPLFANVAGPLFGINGQVLSDYLNFKLFQSQKMKRMSKKGI